MYIKVFCARIVYKGNQKTGTGYKYKTVLLEGLRKFFIHRHIRKCFICYCNFFPDLDIKFKKLLLDLFETVNILANLMKLLEVVPT